MRSPAWSGLAGRVVQACLATGGDAYLTMAPPYEPADATVGALLHHRLSVLRYHRADAHAAAWQAAGLTSEAVTQLPAGPMRSAIEAETNRRAGMPYATLKRRRARCSARRARRASRLNGRHLTECAANVRSYRIGRALVGQGLAATAAPYARSIDGHLAQHDLRTSHAAPATGGREGAE